MIRFTVNVSLCSPHNSTFDSQSSKVGILGPFYTLRHGRIKWPACGATVSPSPQVCSVQLSRAFPTAAGQPLLGTRAHRHT